MKKEEAFNRNGYNEFTGLFKSRYYAKKWVEKNHCEHQRIMKIYNGYLVTDKYSTEKCFNETLKRLQERLIEASKIID